MLSKTLLVGFITFLALVFIVSPAKDMEDYEDLKDQMQIGDVIAFSGTQPISTAIKLVTSSHVSHVGVIVCSNKDATSDAEGPLIAEATENGIEIRPLRERVVDETVKRLWWLPLRSDLRDKLNMEAFQNYVKNADQKAYDYLQVGTLGLLLLEPALEDIAPGVGDRICESIYKILRRDPVSKDVGGLRQGLFGVLLSDKEHPIVRDMIRLLLKGDTSENLSRQLENQSDFENFFCSEFVTGALIASTVISGINASQVTPVDLCRFHIYERSIQFKGERATIRGFNGINLPRWID